MTFCYKRGIVTITGGMFFSLIRRWKKYFWTLYTSVFHCRSARPINDAKWCLLQSCGRRKHWTKRFQLFHFKSKALIPIWFQVSFHFWNQMNWNNQEMIAETQIYIIRCLSSNYPLGVNMLTPFSTRCTTRYPICGKITRPDVQITARCMWLFEYLAILVSE